MTTTQLRSTGKTKQITNISKELPVISKPDSQNATLLARLDDFQMETIEVG